MTILGLVGLFILGFWGMVTFLLMLGDTDGGNYGTPLKQGIFWPFMFFSQGVQDRVLDFNHRIDCADESLRLALLQLEVVKKGQLDEEIRWHFNVAESCVKHAKEWLVQPRK